jgi:hypothetical protein
MCAGSFLVLLDVTIVNVTLPNMRSGLHAGVAFGALAGNPAHAHRFVTGMHTAAAVGAAIWLVVAAVAGVVIQGRLRP